LAQGVNEAVDLSTAELAYLGDAVFELMVRDMLLNQNVPFGALNRRAKAYVSAVAQAGMYHKIFPGLSQREQAAIKRGRNLHNVSRSKNADVSAYRHATGLEALFGHLYHNGEMERLMEVFAMCVEEIEQ